VTYQQLPRRARSTSRGRSSAAEFAGLSANAKRRRLLPDCQFPRSVQYFAQGMLPGATRTDIAIIRSLPADKAGKTEGRVRLPRGSRRTLPHDKHREISQSSSIRLACPTTSRRFGILKCVFAAARLEAQPLESACRTSSHPSRARRDHPQLKVRRPRLAARHHHSLEIARLVDKTKTTISSLLLGVRGATSNSSRSVGDRTISVLARSPGHRKIGFAA